MDGPYENADFEYFYKIIDLAFVKKAFDDIVYHKILLDGYVYCKEGLIPSNKTAFKPLESNKESPLYQAAKDKNPETYQQLYEKFQLCSIPEAYTLSNLENQFVLYLLFQLSSPCNSAKVLMMLYHYYGTAVTYKQIGEFVCRDNIELRAISSLQQFIEYITDLSNAKNLFYRGHSNINYIAVPSLFREKRFYQNEYMMYQELVIRCASSFVNCVSHLDFLMEMQHYGLPTRLLDVTSNPLVALYFACESRKNVGEVVFYNVGNKNIKYEKCDEVSVLTALPMFYYSAQKAIFSAVASGDLLTSRSYNEFLAEVQSERPAHSKDITYAGLTTPIFVKPTRKNSRILRQEGAFIIWGLDDIYYSSGSEITSKDDTFRYRENTKKIVYYILSKDKSGILSSLNRVGINKAFVYPEIDDVASYIKDTIE